MEMNPSDPPEAKVLCLKRGRVSFMKITLRSHGTSLELVKLSRLPLTLGDTPMR